GFTTQWRIGVVGGGFFFDPVVSPLSLKDGLTVGLNGTWAIISGSVSGLYHIVSGDISSCNLSGPIGIAETSGQMARQGGDNFLWFIAVLSAAVGMINLFPVPVLDGGHLVFFGYEALTGRPPNETILNALMMAGLAIILSFMMFALANDLICP
ncbi:MAG: site-2 protease family protein, partial [Paracoccaceae bacterium]|nr:site-2 protease family protein [Paracoccaceae bacterium]